MHARLRLAGLDVDEAFARFIGHDVLPSLPIDSSRFWQGFASLHNDLAPRNRELLARRQSLQQKIDAWHIERRGQSHDAAAYRAFTACI